jgi:hypothetical protein
MWDWAHSETPVFSRETTLVSPSPPPIKPALKSPGVKVKQEEPKSVSFKMDPKPNGRFPVRVRTDEGEEGWEEGEEEEEDDEDELYQ